VALGRAMMRAPQVYLMDEPLSNLDAALRVQVREDLIEFHRETSGTILYVTHDQIEAMTMGERVIVMNGGVIQQSGTPDDVYRRPANTFVATFVGSPRMNLMPGIARTVDGTVEIAAGELSWRYPHEVADHFGDLPADVVVGFRPEAVVPVVPDADRDPANAHFDRVLDFVEHIGHESILRLGTADARVLARVPAGSDAVVGGSATYRVARSAVHVFDAASGAALTHGDQPAIVGLTNRSMIGTRSVASTNLTA